MLYADRNYRTKKALRDAVAAGVAVRVYQPGGMFNPPEAGDNYTGRAAVGGPWYPAPHSWYATVTLTAGRVTAVK